MNAHVLLNLLNEARRRYTILNQVNNNGLQQKCKILFII